jgi:hypothetical protein
MKIIKLISIFVLPVLFFGSCQSSKMVLREMQDLRSELYYDLTTPVYLGEVDNTIYLNFIDYSNINYFTTVEKNGLTIIPLLFYNYSKEKFEITLGEHSLIQPYRDFLMDALLAECNRSACFNLKDNSAAAAPDSALVLDVKINRNKTNCRMELTNSIIFIPLGNNGFDLSFSNQKVANRAVSDLEITVRLIQRATCLWEKTYQANQELDYSRSGLVNSSHAYEICLDRLADNLSLTTKEVVENISRDLHLLMLAKQP